MAAIPDLENILEKAMAPGNNGYLPVEKAFYELGLKTPLLRATVGGALAALLVKFFEPAIMTDEEGRVSWLEARPGKLPAALAVVSGAALFGVLL